MMSSGCEDSSVNTMGIRGIPEQCGCGRRTGIYTSKTKENPGRTFFRCPTFRNILFMIYVHDHLYKWVDEAVYEEVQDALPKVDGFASDLRKLKMEIDRLKNVEEELKENLRKASNEVKKLNVIMKVGFLVASVSCIVIIIPFVFINLTLIMYFFITKMKTQISTVFFLDATKTILIF
ncbi:uncharacterized protein At1g43920, Chloroplastic-like [Raphanus sativus]|uniref:Uncharacterized protein At1g43920, Chloroplastic-like n=1 Tax=Raphanus sativus TaxID=3726 RepID=A0A6J0L145_RAPSA|nr:uncharacterized protein At1g43920, Chloroplastic-like [Raphanus sativus]